LFFFPHAITDGVKGGQLLQGLGPMLQDFFVRNLRIFILS
jgi:hypothetical protein